MRWGALSIMNYSKLMEDTDMKFPKTIFVTKDKNADRGDDLLAWNSIPDEDGAIVAQYELVSTGKISTQKPSVAWGRTV